MSNANEPEESVLLSFMGNAVGARGMGAIVVLVLVAALAGAGFLLYERTNEDRQAMLSIVDSVSQHAAQSQAAHLIIKQMAETSMESSASTSRQLKIQNYIILSDEAEKKEIKKKLGRPSELQ